jgi:hypothetical protein
MAKTLGYIQACRGYLIGWDGRGGVTPTPECLDAAEYLTAFFASWPVARRPQLGIDAEGRPTFAAKVRDFYLHLTIDEPQKLTWYAVVEGNELFQEDVAFDGTQMPPDLAKFAA